MLISDPDYTTSLLGKIVKRIGRYMHPPIPF